MEVFPPKWKAEAEAKEDEVHVRSMQDAMGVDLKEFAVLKESGGLKISDVEALRSIV